MWWHFSICLQQNASHDVRFIVYMILYIIYKASPSNPIQHNHTQASISSSPNPSKSDEFETDKSTSQVYKPIVPFPNRLKNNKQNPHMDKIIAIFNQVKINVPLLDAI